MPITLTQSDEYCMVLARQSGFFTIKTTITVDFGQKKSNSIFSDERLKDQQGKVLKFNSVIGALNYMSSQGWQFVNAYSLSAGPGKVLHYVMKRPKAITY